jgi:Na+-transporting NADH:ubiquinone oxidoreductase subunit C
MNIQSNSYTFFYATLIAVAVAIGLAVVATALQPAQIRNVELEKKQNILTSLRIVTDKTNAEKLYDQYITDSYTLNYQGQKIPDVDPFDINLRAEMKKNPGRRNLPVFKATMGDSTFLVIPVYGKGLWGPIWGYVSFLEDKDLAEGLPRYNTIYGVMFDHKSETPGLGAEINQPFFMLPFRGKKIFDQEGRFVSIQVVKGGADPASEHQVDAISGGTITSKGLEAMVDSCLAGYQTYFKMIN